MQYRLYKNGHNDTSNVLKEVLNNREIDDYSRYLNLDENVVIPYENLDNMRFAVDMFMKHFNQKNKIAVLVDTDPDGYCSAAMIYMYVKRMEAEYPISYILHSRTKAHGLTEDVSIPQDIELLIIPDAGTNDVEACRNLNNKGADILILDHHEKEEENPFALIVNNQMSKNYPNKHLCGAGVVYKFLQAMDDENWNEFADDYLDLCALANISDAMDMRSYETRYLTSIGLLHIKNKFLKALISAQDYSLKGKLTIHNTQWYITPVLNGMIRVGSEEEKELLFRAFIEQDALFMYKKRNSKDKKAAVIKENIYDRAARLCKNAKARQDKLKEKSIGQIVKIIDALPQSGKVIMVDTSDVLDAGLTGVVAVKIAGIYGKPCILVNKVMDGKTDNVTYKGSARNINSSPIGSFKDIVNSTGVFHYGKGHANAFGVSLDTDRLEDAESALNNALRDVVYDSTYLVDFILDIQDVSVKLVTELSKFDSIICQGIEEPRIAVENITLNRASVEIFGRSSDTLCFTVGDIKYIQFKCTDKSPLYCFLQSAWDEDDLVFFHLVGKPTINEYNGVKTPQIIIEDTVLIHSNSDINAWIGG